MQADAMAGSLVRSPAPSSQPASVFGKKGISGSVVMPITHFILFLALLSGGVPFSQSNLPAHLPDG